jgi:hypothetical protein
MRDLLLVLGAALVLRAAVATGPLPSAGQQTHEPSPAVGTWRRADRDGALLLLFGESRARPLAGLRCDSESGSLLVERMTVAPSGGIETMTIRADNRARTLPVLWDGATLPIAIAELELENRMVDSLARRSGTIQIELGDEPLLVLPADRQLGDLIEECRRG